MVAALLNTIETLLDLLYVYLAHVKGSPAAAVVGFSAASMTLSKTILYVAQEYFCEFCAIGHNNFVDIAFFWVMPNMYVQVVLTFGELGLTIRA